MLEVQAIISITIVSAYLLAVAALCYWKFYRKGEVKR